MNNLDGRTERSKFRREAWCSAFRCVEMTSLFVSAASTALSLARSNLKDGQENVEKILFWFEVCCLFISSLIQWMSNISMIENLRLLHKENKKALELAGDTDAYGNSNGLAKKVTLPTHIAFFIAILGSTASILFFCNAFSKTDLSDETSKMISELVGTSSPFISSAIASLAKSRLEKEEGQLEGITGKTADNADTAEHRNVCKVLFPCCC